MWDQIDEMRFCHSIGKYPILRFAYQIYRTLNGNKGTWKYNPAIDHWWYFYVCKSNKHKMIKVSHIQKVGKISKEKYWETTWRCKKCKEEITNEVFLDGFMKGRKSIEDENRAHIS